MNYKKALTLPPNIVDSTINFDNLDEGLNDFIFGKRTIHSYFRKYNNNTLFVFLSAIGVNAEKPYPLFNRISWESEFKGNVLYFDDPTRNEIDFAPSFYFGDVENNCLDQISLIIQRIQTIIGNNNEELCFISSSNGGFAALYLANMFKKSTCIALCPQFDVDLFFENKIDTFYKRLNIDKNKFLKRLNVYDIFNNNESNFLIYSNIRCNSDKLQIEGFCNHHNIQYREGLNKFKNNLYFIISDINAIDTHIAQPGAKFCVFVWDYLFKYNFDELMNDSINLFLSELKKSFCLQLELYITKKYIPVLQNIDKIIINDNCADICLKDIYKSYFRITNYMASKIIISLRIHNWKKYSSIDKIQSCIRKINFNIDYDDNVINIYSNKFYDYTSLGFYYDFILKECF